MNWLALRDLGIEDHTYIHTMVMMKASFPQGFQPPWAQELSQLQTLLAVHLYVVHDSRWVHSLLLWSSPVISWQFFVAKNSKKNGDHHNHTLQKNDSFCSNTKKKYMFVHSSKAVNSLIFSASANGSSAGGNNSWCEWLPQQAMRLRGLLHVYPGEN